MRWEPGKMDPGWLPEVTREKARRLILFCRLACIWSNIRLVLLCALCYGIGLALAGSPWVDGVVWTLAVLVAVRTYRGWRLR